MSAGKLGAESAMAGEVAIQVLHATGSRHHIVSPGRAVAQSDEVVCGYKASPEALLRGHLREVLVAAHRAVVHAIPALKGWWFGDVKRQQAFRYLVHRSPKEEVIR